MAQKSNSFSPMSSDLLKQTNFNYYNPGKFGSAYGRDIERVKSDVGDKWKYSSAFTDPKSNNVYLTVGFNDNRINGGRVIVHELFHRAGVRTKKGRFWDTDPVDSLDDEIKKNCSPNSQGR